MSHLRQAIRSWVEEKKVRWEFHFELLAKYTEKHGNCRVHKDYETIVSDKTVKLGSWFNDQKKQFASLPLSKQERLQALPGFVAKKFKRNQTLSVDAWIDLYIAATRRLGSPLIPPRYVEDGYNLGAWMQHIRKEKEWWALSSQQKQRLFDHNFKLSPSEEWAEAAVRAMAQFAAREGHTVPKSEHKELIVHKGLEYSIRLDNLRNRIKKTPDQTDPIVLKGVQDIPNFLEELRSDEEDDDTYLAQGLQYYRKFKLRTNCGIVPKDHIEDDFDLSCWDKSVSTRRRLTETFKEELLQIDPYYFAKHSTRVFMQDLRPRIDVFIRQNSHALIPQDYVCSDGYLLGQRISDLRGGRYKLPKAIADYLNSLGDKWAWNYFEYLHVQNAKILISHFEKNGYNPKALPNEMRQLKAKIKKGFLKYSSSSSLKTRIEELAPGIFDDPKDEHYLALLRYAAREGHACPPIKHIEDEKKTGLYVSNIRQKYKNKQMSANEQAKYESLKGWLWDASGFQSSLVRENQGGK